MPPVVTGVIVMIIGLNLAPVAIKSVSANQFDSWMALITIICISVIAVFTEEWYAVCCCYWACYLPI